MKAAKARLQQQQHTASVQQEQLQPVTEPTTTSVTSSTTTQPENLSSQQEGIAPIRSEEETSDTQQSPGLRHRQPAAQREGPTAQVHGKKNAVPNDSGTVSYVVMWVLIVAIVGLLLRRLFYS